MNGQLIVAIVINIIALLLLMLGVAVPNWYAVTMSGTHTTYYGLWEICASVKYNTHVCRSFGAAGLSTEDWWDANAALQAVAMVLSFIALVLGVFCLFCLKYRPQAFVLAGVFCLVAFLGSLVGIIIFGIKFDDGNNLDGSNLHVSFYLALIGFLMSLVAGILYFVAKPKYGTKSIEFD